MKVKERDKDSAEESAEECSLDFILTEDTIDEPKVLYTSLQLPRNF